MTDKDDRWTMKGSDGDIFERFRERKAEYNQQRDERVTDERALELLMDDAPVERDADMERVLEVLDSLPEQTASVVVEQMQSNRY